MNSDYAAQAAQHARRVMELASAYFRTWSEAASEALVDLYPQTSAYRENGCAGYEGVLAIHAHILALRYVNEAYNPSKAFAFSRLAEQCYRDYLQSDALRTRPSAERETAQRYLEHVWLLCAYVDYVQDNLPGAGDWLMKIPLERVGVSGVALLACVQFRMLCEEGRDAFFQTAFALFQKMDEWFQAPVPYLFEEDILRTAYGFYEMYYTHGVVNPQLAVPYDPARAAAMLRRAEALLTDAQQKAWMRQMAQQAAERGAE